VRETCYEPHSIMLGGVPNTNIVRNVPRLPKSSAKYWGGQSIWTHPYEPQFAQSHWQHSPTWATTQEFLVFIRHPKPQLKRCHSEPQLKEHFSKPTFKVSPKPCRSRTSKQTVTLPFVLSLGAASELPGETQFQSAWRGLLPLGIVIATTGIARRDDHHRQAPLVPVPPWFGNYRLLVNPPPPPPGAASVLA